MQHALEAIDLPGASFRSSSSRFLTGFTSGTGADVIAGLVASILTIAFGLSYAALIFSGPLTPLLGSGIAATFVASAVIALVICLGSSFRFAVGAIDSSTAAVAGILSVTLAERLLALHPDTPLLAPILLTLSATTALTGVLLCIFGIARIGRATRYVPYPVIGGFLGATGCLIIVGALRVMRGDIPGADLLVAFATPHALAQLAAAILTAAVIAIALFKLRRSIAIPIVLIGVTIIAHLVRAISGLSLAETQALGWTFKPPLPSPPHLPWELGEIKHYPWDALVTLLGNVFAVIFVTAITTLFNATGIEVETHKEADIDRELTTAGVANLLAGALGGYAGCISLSRSILTHRVGARTRLTGLIVATTSAIMAFANPGFLAYMPKFALAGLLLYMGVDQLKRWIIDSRRRLSVTDYVSLLAIVVIIMQWGFVAGVLIGTIIGCATFALSVSRINSIKYGFSGLEYRSSLDRSRSDTEILDIHGGEIRGLNLQSYLFFGSANRLYRHVKELIAHHPECRYLVFDFSLVTGADSSATYSFSQIKRVASEHHIEIILVGVARKLETSFRSSQFVAAGVHVMPELDHALERCENKVIEKHRQDADEESTLRDWFEEILGSEAMASELMDRCHRVEAAAGAVIAQTGEKAERMHFILSGRVNVLVPINDERRTRLRSLGPKTTIGEMGLLTQRPRSATIEAETASVLYELPAGEFQAIMADSPELGHKLLMYFVSIMAERLAFSNRTVSVLRR